MLRRPPLPDRADRTDHHFENIYRRPARRFQRLALGGGSRALPGALRAVGKFEQQLSQEDVNGLIRSMNNTWSGRSINGSPNSSLGASVGGNDKFFGRQIGYLLSGTYSLAQEARVNEVRALAFPGDDGATSEIDRFEGSTTRSSVLWGGIANFSTLIGSATRLGLNTGYNRSADNEARSETGFSDDGAFRPEISRLRYVERSVASAQLLGEHEPGSGHRIDWSITGSQVTRSIYYPHSIYVRPPYKQSPAFVWFQFQENSVKGITRLVTRYGGRDPGYRSHACQPQPKQQGASLLWEQCRVTWSQNASPISLFGSIIEHEGHFKFVSYANDL